MRNKFNLEIAISRIMKRYRIRYPTAGQWSFVLSRVHVPGLYINPQKINLDTLEMLLHDYVYQCYLHNQIVSICGFSKLAKISRQTLFDWHCGKSRRDNEQAKRIYETLKDERLTSIQGALDSPSRCMGALALLRHECNWTGERLEDFADAHGLIHTDSVNVAERYKAVCENE